MYLIIFEIINVNNANIKLTDFFRVLGLNINVQLRFKMHVTQCVRKANPNNQDNLRTQRVIYTWQ